MDVAEQRGREEEAFCWQGRLRLPARGAFCHALVDQALDAIELHAGYDCPDVDGLVEWSADAEGAHAVADFCDEDFGDAFLH